MKKLLTALALATVFAASAADVTLTGWTFGTGNQVSTTLYSGEAGGFTGALTSNVLTSPSFNTYCVELTEYFSFSQSPMTNYNVVAGATYFNSAAKADTLGSLMTYVEAHPVTTAAQSTSLQLAIWNTVYDTDSSLSSGAFEDMSPYAALANTFLQDAASTVSTMSVYVLQKSGSQDFLLTVPNQALLPPVPEPSALALLLAGLGAIAFKAKRC